MQVKWLFIKKHACISLQLNMIMNIQVSADGYFSFGRGVTCCPTLSVSSSTSNFIVAPFESNTNVATGVGRVSYEVHNTTTSPTLLNRVNRYVQQSMQSGFTGIWMLVGEWNSVPQSGQSTSVVGSTEF